jgi:spore maturation protein CgeB
VADVHRGWVNGLRANGCQVVDFNYSERLEFYEVALKAKRPDEEHGSAAIAMASKGIEAACYEFWPDVVLIVSGFYVPPAVIELCRARGSKVWVLATESPYEDGSQLAIAPHVDGMVLNDPTNLASFKVHTQAMFLPHAYDPSIHRRTPQVADYRSDFCFVGTGYPSRVEFFEACDFDGVDVALAGNWNHLDPESPLRKYVAHDIDQCLPNSEAVDLYSNTAASANIYRTEAQTDALSNGWAMSPREVELAAIGCFYLTEPRGENREVLPMLPTFTGPGEFSESLKWWLAHEPDRLRVATEAQRAVADRTFTNTTATWLAAV